MTKISELDFIEKPVWTLEAKNLGEFINYVNKWADLLNVGDIVLLNGPVGAGKTVVTRSAVERLGGRWVSSPSFAIHQRYAVVKGFVDHVDLYRLKNDADLDSTGFWELFDHKDNLFFIEWADRLPLSVWPKDRTIWSVFIEVASENTRRLTITKN